jgi:hypothetical protein
LSHPRITRVDTGGPVVVDGLVELTEASGHGIDVDEEALRRCQHTRSGIGVFSR